MSSEDIIQVWKDPDGRDDDPGIDHPSGRIELTVGDDMVGATATPCLSVAVSALIRCADSIMHGTCGAFSYGCC